MTAAVRSDGPMPATDETAIFFGEGSPVIAEITQTWSTEGSDRQWADDVLAGLGPDERALASLSFVAGGSAVAHRVDRQESVITPATPNVAGQVHDIAAIIDEDRYADIVRAALERIEADQLQKVVLGRVVDITSNPPLSPLAVVGRMLVTRPGRYVFSMPLRAGAGAPIILGASPELLIRRQGLDVTSLPLAGSIPHSDDKAEDQRRADALLASAKDQAEHAFVVDGITELLAAHCSEYDAAPTPTLLSTDTMWHLATPIRGRLRSGDASLSALHLARMLQPTAAVGGTPTDLAQQTIAELEGDLRGHLAGAVGWVDGAGNGEFALALRSGVLQDNRLRLFAGAGIVRGSDPATETREVGAKLQTMMRAVGI